ncbi:hypothetical protein P3T37_005372 [Kitasatospora sp. MAA4]|uniref:DUF2752 domain-containing protein n=1 Tax=Kitasatospora sp. MAA4 TaxID=3035093 RepID=UPI00247443CC|nr:DUF2752 domain-containing protein [Kitasatospora sp. MAA4]MDH6135953.1 hypothetical protein [Kitasatospora sp. MAA4]
MITPVRAAPATATPAGRLARTALRCGLAAGAALAVAALHDAHDPGVLCPLRRLTGIPCPACGSTTVFIEAGHGHWLAALTANPVTVVGVIALLTAPLGGGAWWWRQAPRTRNALIAGAAVTAWLWQLNRLGV